MIVLGYCGLTRDSRDGAVRRSFGRTAIDFDGLFHRNDGSLPFTSFPPSFLGHDAAAAILVDGQLVACAAEERFSRCKHSLNLAGNTLLPRRAIEYCLRRADVTVRDIDVVAHNCAFDETVIARRAQLLEPFVAAKRLRAAFRDDLQSMLSREAVQRQFEEMTGTPPKVLLRVPHHEAHAASAFFASGFDQALVFTLDGTGELESSLLAVGSGSTIAETTRTWLPTSLGALYLAVTVYLGFKSIGDEYKVMGLAAYGDPSRFSGFFSAAVQLEGGGRYSTPWLAGGKLRERMLGELGPARRPGEALERRHMDVAAALQEALESAVLHSLRHARDMSGQTRLCMAGGVALNCKLNGAIARSGLFQEIFVQPAAGDEGTCVGAAIVASNSLGEAVLRDRWGHVFYGPSYQSEEILDSLRPYAAELRWTQPEDLSDSVVALLMAGAVVGWFQGRMEFGPRALGARSILADPRRPSAKDQINAKVKHREPFRPFGPAVLREEAGDWFELGGLTESPFMLFALRVRPHRQTAIPAVVHVDGTSRIQTVSRHTNPLFWDLISRFGDKTGVPMLLNTSFNIQGEPIVCSPSDAIRCFRSTGIDVLAIGSFLVHKKTSGDNG